MQYVPPLRILADAGSVERSDSRITLPLESFYAILRAAFEGPAFDPDWYLATYPDVATAIADGVVPDAVTHFVRFGYFENRRPRSFDIDVRWYEDAYQDVAGAIRSGSVSDARSHFNTNGYFEARAPTAEAASAFATLLMIAAARSETAVKSATAPKRSRR
ncbi:hypothetical protein [Acidisoma sp.]|uniref:hypothetical protein n=1 Tax=Acidisoma sp. TaxID=1872115 RepID=UPI003AFFD03C